MTSHKEGGGDWKVWGFHRSSSVAVCSCLLILVYLFICLFMYFFILSTPVKTSPTSSMMPKPKPYEVDNLHTPPTTHHTGCGLVESGPVLPVCKPDSDDITRGLSSIKNRR